MTGRHDVARRRAFWLANRPGETKAPAYVAPPPTPLVAAIALGVALALGASAPPLLRFRGGTVSPVLLVAIWYAMRAGALRGATFGLIAGACEDALTGTSGVAWTFATALACALAGRVTGTWFADLRSAVVPTVAALALVRAAVAVVIMAAQGHRIGLPSRALHGVLYGAALDAAVALVVLVAFPAVRGRRGIDG